MELRMHIELYIYIFLVFILLMLGLLVWYAYRRVGPRWTVKTLLKDFNRKMWMTLYLGVTFFTFYFMLVTLGASFFRLWGSKLLFLALKDPTPFIYLGLCVFAILSLSIYLVRMIIKYAYLTRGKDGG